MKNSVIYMGLFLMAFALYAQEREKPPIRIIGGNTNDSEDAEIVDSLNSSAGKPVIEGTASDAPGGKSSAKIQELFEAFSADPLLLKAHADGLRLTREPHAIVIQLFGEDVFAEGEISMREGWYSVLDRVALKLTPEEFKRGLKVEVRGFADEASQREQKPSDFGQSDFSFSFARAEWVARYFERKFRIPLQEVFTLKGMGARPYGKKVEIWFTY